MVSLSEIGPLIEFTRKYRKEHCLDWKELVAMLKNDVTPALPELPKETFPCRGSQSRGEPLIEFSPESIEMKLLRKLQISIEQTRQNVEEIKRILKGRGML